MSDLSLFLSLAVLQTFPSDIKPSEAADYRFLQALALVESGANHKAVGDNYKAVGAWQMHYAAWIDSNNWLRRNGRKTWTRSQWPIQQAQREVAYAYLQVCKERLEAGGHKVTPQSLALVWNMGFGNYNEAKSRNKQPSAIRLDYASRVEAIFLHAK